VLPCKTSAIKQVLKNREAFANEVGLTDPIKKRKYGGRRFSWGPNDLALSLSARKTPTGTSSGSMFKQFGEKLSDGLLTAASQPHQAKAAEQGEAGPC
jgi:hypothetical protein